MLRSSILLPTAATLLAIWSVVGFVMHVTDPYISTPEKVSLIFDNPPWKGGKKPSPAQRKAYLDELAKYYKMLDMKDRRMLREADAENMKMSFFIAELTEDERKYYLSQMIESEMQPLMKLWGNLTKEERRKFVGGARGAMRRDGRDTASLDRLVEADEKVFDKLIEGDIAGYYKEGDDKRKINLAPLMEELQARVQGVRRR